MNREQEKIKVLLKCFDAIAHTTRENLDGYDSEWLEMKLVHLNGYIALTMEKITDIYEVEQTELAEKREIRKIEEEIIESNLKKAKDEYPISWDEVDKEREKAKKQTLETLTKPLSKEAKKKYVGTHSKAGKAPKRKLSLWNRVLQNSRKPEKEVTDEEKHEIVAYVQKLHKNKKMKVGAALTKIGLDSWKYYRWRKNEGLQMKCKQCKTSQTPQWRQYADGIYCNACGIRKYRKAMKKAGKGKK